jgi:hypothetical protein
MALRASRGCESMLMHSASGILLNEGRKSRRVSPQTRHS